MTETLEHAYKSAVAVLTAPVSFVEWTILKVESSTLPNPRTSSDWSPIVMSLKSSSTAQSSTSPPFSATPSQYPIDVETYAWDTTQKIVGERYIYAFSRRMSSSDQLTLVEELKLTEDGTIYAAQMGPRRYPDPPLDGADSPLPKTRQWKKIGSTIRFVRRLRGSRMAHFFFASRIQLSRRFIEELRSSVIVWVPETLFDESEYMQPMTFPPGAPVPLTFGEWDTNVVTGVGAGALQVPVVDPLTIAVNLNKLAICAGNHLYDYSTTHDRQSEEKDKLVRNRQKKILLANVLQMVLATYEKDKHPKVDVSEKTNLFIREYGEQMDYRIGEMERWWTYLANWYQSAPINFLSRAHYELPNDNRWKFLLPMMLCLLDANSSKAGRELLVALVKKSENWFRYAVLPGPELKDEKDPLAELYQPPRKFLLAVLEVFKEAALHIDHSTESMFRVLAQYSKHFNIRFLIDGAEMDKDPLTAANKFRSAMKEIKIDVGTGEEIVQEWHEIADHHAQARVRPLLTVTTVVEIIDLILSLRQFLIDPSARHAITIVRSVADTSALLLEFAHGVRGGFLFKLMNLRWGFIAVAAVIEAAFSARDMVVSGAKHDTVGTFAGFTTYTGAAVTLLGALDLAGGALLETPYFTVGLILMGIGTIIGFFKDDSMDTFLKHCIFGSEQGGGEIVEGLGEIRKHDYGQQLKILINLLCMFKVEHATHARGDYTNDARAARITMGWIPDHANLVVDYDDKWSFRPGRRTDTLSPNDSEGSTHLTQNNFFQGRGGTPLNAERQFDLVLSKAPRFNEVNIDSSLDYFKAHFSARLEVAFGPVKIVVPPEPVELTIAVGNIDH